MSTILYDQIGVGYSAYRRPDTRIAARVADALGPARSVVNVGAGTGSYEPADRTVVAVEPSGEMVRQRGPGAAPAIRAVAEALPLADGSFDAALGILTIHHWPDWRAGLREMRRVARDRVVLLTWDPDHPGFWLVQDYFPEILETDRCILPSLAAMESELGPMEVRPVPVPADCRDGFLGAYWRRLRSDLADGSWNARHGHLLALPELDIGYRIIVAPVA